MSASQLGRLLCVLCLSFLAFTIPARSQSAEEPTYEGKSLSNWADQLLALNKLSNIVDTNRVEVRAMRAIGTNAIPWLLTELNRPLSSNERDRLRARSRFWALGEIASPAIPRLLALVEQEPDLAPSCLAGIGSAALPALERCLTNRSPTAPIRSNNHIAASTLGGLYVAIDVGRISTNQVAYLLPTVRSWSAAADSTAAYWARGVLRKFDGEN